MATRNITSLDRIMNGGVNERFNQAFREILENAMDVNTPEKTKRKLTLTITVAPNAARDAADFAVDIKTTLVPPKALEQTVFLASDGMGGYTAMEKTDQLPGQMDMDGDVVIPNVVKFGQ